MDYCVNMPLTRGLLASNLGYHIQDAIIFGESDDFADRYNFSIVIEAPFDEVLERMIDMVKPRLPKDKKILDIQVSVFEYDVGIKIGLSLAVWVQK